MILKQIFGVGIVVPAYKNQQNIVEHAIGFVFIDFI